MARMATPDDNKNYADIADKVALRATMVGTPERSWTPQMRALKEQLQADSALNDRVDRGVLIAAREYAAGWDSSGQDSNLSAYMQAYKKQDRARTRQAWDRMSPEAQQSIWRDIGQSVGSNVPRGQSLTDILSDKDSSIMDKLSALAKAAVQMITDAFSGFARPEARQERNRGAAPIAPKSAEAPKKDDDASPAPAPSPELSPEQMRHIEETSAILSSNIDADDQSNPDAALADNPGLSVSGQLGLAAFDLAVHGAISARFAVEIQNKQFNDEFSMTGGEGTLQKFFEERFEATPEEKKKKENEEALRDAIENAEERSRQQDRMQTMSQRDLDAMEWEGNSYEVWNFGSLSGTRKDAYKWAKATRAKLDQISQENGWTEAERAHEERLLSDFMKATKTGDREAAQKAWKDMKPRTQEAINQERTQDQNRTLDSENLDQKVALRASSRQSGTTDSVDARADMFAAVAPSAPPPVSPDAASDAFVSLNPVTRAAISAELAQTAKTSSLSNPPDVKLTDDFTLAAADKPVTPAAEQNVQLASVAAAPKAAAPVLNQEFSFS